MAKKLSDYADSPAVANYPNGKLVDESAPGANDGTLLREIPVNDMWTCFAKMMDNANITWSGGADNQTTSQFFEALIANVMPVGSLMNSFLTETQFNAQPGYDATKWVICDGRSVTGSRYHTVTGQTSIPNAQSRFQRMASTPDNLIRGFQPHSIGTHNHVMSHIHQQLYLASSGSDAVVYAMQTKSPSTVSFTGGSPAALTLAKTGVTSGTDISPSIPSGAPSAVYTAGVDNSPGGSGSTAVTGATSTASTETRPDTIIVNTFIRIN